MGIVALPDDSVTTTPEAGASTDWQRSMRAAIRDPVELCQRLRLPDEHHRAAAAAAASFPLFVPLEYLARIQPGDPGDPLLRQVLPLGEELVEVAGFTADPVGDAPATCQPGLLRKYEGRALLVTTGTCAVHCRYCFRREFPYTDVPKASGAWRAAIDHVASDPTVDEVILSGGDPLTLVDDRLEALVERLAAIPHLSRLRVHTRLPIMIPSRVTEALLRWLTGSRLTPIMVIHANHPRELDNAVAGALERIAAAGVLLLNQSVLLAGVNDQPDVLVELSQRLVQLRVIPYYLHQLDRIRGAAHFEVPVERGADLVRQLRKRLPGYAVPQYVQEVPGAPGKTALV